MVDSRWRSRVRAWRNIAQSAVMRRLDPNWIPQPHAGHFIVTYKCNLKCQGCGSWKVRRHDDLSALEWRRVFSQLESLDIVKILGGEPFVRDDIGKILISIREEVDPYILQLTTNGMLGDRLIDTLHSIAWPGLQLRISVDGMPSTHDQMRGVDGSWEKVDQTVKRVAEIKHRYGFQFGINFAVTDSSMSEMDKMLSYAMQHDADLIPGLNVDPFLVGTQPPEIKTPKVIMISDAEKAMEALSHTKAGVRGQLPLVDQLWSRRHTKRTFQRQLNGDSQAFHCRELKDLIYVLPNGDLVRCGLDHRAVGNLRRSSFADLWYGTDIKEHRKRVDDCPGCLQASVQILSRLYGGCVLS